jgi:SAM-dependent methyltransferase
LLSNRRHEHHRSQFDLVVMRHVIEHLMDPESALRKIAQSLAPDGLYYVATPDMMHPDGSLNDFWYRSVHTYYFSEITLTRLAARAGLEPVVIRSDNAELWGIFRRSESFREPKISVYRDQLQTLRSYKIRRGVRAILLVFFPKKISGILPKSIKNLFPKNLKAKFRHLVYRH